LQKQKSKHTLKAFSIKHFSSADESTYLTTGSGSCRLSGG